MAIDVFEFSEKKKFDVLFCIDLYYKHQFNYSFEKVQIGTCIKTSYCIFQSSNRISNHLDDLNTSLLIYLSAIS